MSIRYKTWRLQWALDRVRYDGLTSYLSEFSDEPTSHARMDVFFEGHIVTNTGCQDSRVHWCVDRTACCGSTQMHTSFLLP
jgi:hypothetical protein